MRGSCFTTIYNLFLRPLYLSCFILVFTSCNYSKIKDQKAYDALYNKTETPLDTSTLISWNLMENQVLKVCLACHNGQTPPQLNRYDLMKEKLVTVTQEISHNDMPPANQGYAPLSDCYKAIFDEWVRQGAPENTQTPISQISACAGKDISEKPQKEKTLEEMPLNYETLLTQILQPKCIMCHREVGPDEPPPQSGYEDVMASFLPFYPYEKLMKKQRFWRAPGEESKVVEVLRSTEDDRMPPVNPVTKELHSLTESEIQFIIRWIDAGLPKN